MPSFRTLALLPGDIPLELGPVTRRIDHDGGCPLPLGYAERLKNAYWEKQIPGKPYLSVNSRGQMAYRPPEPKEEKAYGGARSGGKSRQSPYDTQLFRLFDLLASKGLSGKEICKLVVDYWCADGKNPEWKIHIPGDPEPREYSVVVFLDWREKKLYLRQARTRGGALSPLSWDSFAPEGLVHQLCRVLFYK